MNFCNLCDCTDIDTPVSYKNYDKNICDKIDQMCIVDKTEVLPLYSNIVEIVFPNLTLKNHP